MNEIDDILVVGTLNRSVDSFKWLLLLLLSDEEVEAECLLLKYCFFGCLL